MGSRRKDENKNTIIHCYRVSFLERDWGFCNEENAEYLEKADRIIKSRETTRQKVELFLKSESQSLRIVSKCKRP